MQSVEVKFDAIKGVLANARITQTMLKPFTKIQTATFTSPKFLLEMARGFHVLDGMLSNASDGSIMTMYGISAGENTDVDPRIALAILINKGNPEADRIINAAVRQVLLADTSGRDTSSDLGNASGIGQNATESRGLWLEVKTEPEKSGLNSLVGIPTNEHEPEISGSKVSEAEYFPKGSKITKPIADVRGYLEVAIRQNLSDPDSQSMISVNELIEASGVKIHLAHWMENSSSKSYVNAVMRNTGKTRDEVFRSIPSKGTWVHILIAIEIARWIDPDFSVMVNEIALRVMGGDLSLIPQIADQYDKLNGAVTNIVSVAAGNADQVRQTTVTSQVYDAMTMDETKRQEMLNAQQAAFNHSAWRELDFSIPMTRAMLYENDSTSGRIRIAKEPDGRNPKVAVECMLKALRPDLFKPGYITSLYDCIEIMWFLIANYENSLAVIAERDEKNQGEDLSMDAQDRINRLENTIKALRRQLTDITNASKLRPLIEGILKTRGHANHPDLDLNSIANLIDSVLNGDYTEHENVMAINWHLSYSLGQDLKSHRDFRNLVAVINDVADILRADLESEEYIPAITKSFGDIFAPADARGINVQMPSYWQALSLPDVNAFTCAVTDPWATCDSDTESKEPAQKELNPENAYAMLTPVVATKKRAAPTRVAVAKKAESMPDELRAALLKNIEDRANSMSICFMNSIDDYSLQLYFGQLGWAGNIVPKKYTAAPSLVLLVSTREILDAGAWHFRPAGQITLIHPLTVQKAITKLGLATDRDRKPIVQAVNQGAVSMTKAYDTSQGAPWIAVKNMITVIADTLGKASVSTILYPDDAFGATWRMVTVGTM